MIKNEYEEIIRAAIAGGNVAGKYFGKSLKIEGKSMPADFRTKADLEAEKAILKILEKNFPKYNIISEEAGEINKNSEYTFIIDPLDGTNNFVLGIPNFSTGIGLMKSGETIFSAVYNPVLKNIYFAEKGKGAYLNNKKIYVNGEADIKNSSICYCRGYGTPEEHAQKVIASLAGKNVKRVLRNWSIILDFCLLASGRLEAVIVYGNLPIHDIVSGKLIAKEAGALITDYNGNKEEDKNTTLLASNGTKIHQELLKIL